MSIGRNDPCPCGSGRKYKKCCVGKEVNPKPTIPDYVFRQIAKRRMSEEARKGRFGDVKPIISATFQDHRFVAVGNKVHFSKSWRTFPDFLFDYIKHLLGSGWGKNELAKPLVERHEILQWYNHLCEVQQGLTRDEDRLYALVPDGIMSAYLLLAYDLYILRHHGKLQREVLRRIRLSEQFRGARYELFVAATFIRAGFDIAFEDESDPTKKHPEFAAVHKSTQLVVSVEAKTKQRVVINSGQDQISNRPTVRPRVRRMLRNAAAKQTDHPLAVFVELNLPPGDSMMPPSWIAEVQQDLSAVVAEQGGRAPFDLVTFTNLPHQYGQPGEPDPLRQFYVTWPSTRRIPEEIASEIGRALTQYGNVPNEFPADFG